MNTLNPCKLYGLWPLPLVVMCLPVVMICDPRGYGNHCLIDQETPRTHIHLWSCPCINQYKSRDQSWRWQLPHLPHGKVGQYPVPPVPLSLTSLLVFPILLVIIHHYWLFIIDPSPHGKVGTLCISSEHAINDESLVVGKFTYTVSGIGYDPSPHGCFSSHGGNPKSSCSNNL